MKHIIKANHRSARLESIFGGSTTEGVALLHTHTFLHHIHVIRVVFVGGSTNRMIMTREISARVRGSVHRIRVRYIYTLSKITVLYDYYYYYYQRLKSVPRVFERLPWCASFCGFKIHFHAHTRTATANPLQII